MAGPAKPVNDDRFMKPVPGYSLTQTPGKFPWDSPPDMVDPDEVVTSIIDNLEKPHVEERITKLMLAGVSVEEIVHSISMTGFMEGRFSPDVGEMIKGPVGMYLLGVADEKGIPVKVFGDEEKLKREREGDLDDYTILEIMKQRNPEFHEFMTKGYYNKEEDTQVQRSLKGREGFLAVEEGEPEMGETMMLEGTEAPRDEMMEDEA